MKAFGTVYIDEKPYKILSFRAGEGGFAYLGLRGVPDRNAAELLRGRKIEGDREDEPELEELLPETTLELLRENRGRHGANEVGKEARHAF